MREQKENMPVAMEQPGFKLLSPGAWGGIVVEYLDCTERIEKYRKFVFGVATNLS